MSKREYYGAETVSTEWHKRFHHVLNVATANSSILYDAAARMYKTERHAFVQNKYSTASNRSAGAARRDTCLVTEFFNYGF